MKMIYHQEVKLEPEETIAEKVRLSARKKNSNKTGTQLKILTPKNLVT